MRLTNIAANRLLGSLQNLDADTSVKLGQLRLKIAQNINILKPFCDAHTRAQTQLRAEIVGDKFTPEKQFVAEAELAKAAEVEIDHDFRLHKIQINQLRLEENQQITSDQIAALMPILKGFKEACPFGPEDDD